MHLLRNKVKTKLNQIAQIQTGVYAKTNLPGKAHYLQVSDLGESGEVIHLTQLDLLVDERIERHLLKDSDVLFVAKGSRNFAALYRASAGPAIASTSFLILRIRDQHKSRVLPEYLVWFINHRRTQERLKALAKGSGIPSVAISDLADIEIPIPPVQAQRKILTIQQLRDKEGKLVAEIEALKELYIQRTLFSHANS